jgi:hypothetical protein
VTSLTDDRPVNKPPLLLAANATAAAGTDAAAAAAARRKRRRRQTFTLTQRPMWQRPDCGTGPPGRSVSFGESSSSGGGGGSGLSCRSLETERKNERL